MRQYRELLQAILGAGTPKPAARANMPGTISLFGSLHRYDLAAGFPAVTTKKLYFNHVVTELLWFLKGDDNIKFMVDRRCNIWNQDAYSYYLKKFKEHYGKDTSEPSLTLEAFERAVKQNYEISNWFPDYTLGNTGFQYPIVWRQWEGKTEINYDRWDEISDISTELVDQITNVIKSLRETPESRRHIVTAIDPAHDTDLALYWCHAMFQFNCRPIGVDERVELRSKMPEVANYTVAEMCQDDVLMGLFDRDGVPKYYLDCELYQRSADAFLGVPFNIASYALLTHIFAKMCNMVPGHFVHTFGDVHIYDNHLDAVKELLSREPLPLPTLQINSTQDWTKMSIDEVLSDINDDTFKLINYKSHPAIQAELKTGLL